MRTDGGVTLQKAALTNPPVSETLSITTRELKSDNAIPVSQVLGRPPTPPKSWTRNWCWQAGCSPTAGKLPWLKQVLEICSYKVAVQIIP